MVSKLDTKIKNIVFRQMFLNLARCLVRQRAALTSTEIKSIVRQLIRKAIDSGAIATNMMHMVDEGMDDALTAPITHHATDDILKSDVVASIISERSMLAEDLRSEEDVQIILRFSLAEIECNKAKREFLKLIEKPTQAAITEFLDIFSHDLKDLVHK